MGLDLVHNRNHSGFADEGIDCVNAKVGNSNSLDFGLWKSDHGLPGIEQTDAVVDVDVVVGVGVFTFAGIKGEKVLASGTGVKRNRPVNDCLMVRNLAQGGDICVR